MKQSTLLFFKYEKFIDKSKILKLLLILSLIENNFELNDYIDYRKKNHFNNQSILKIFIMTHKDFKNNRYNPIYKIVADDKSQLKRKYNLNIFYSNEGKLYNMSRAYGEMSKLYYIYDLYKNGNISSKYIGMNNYRRYFDFTDDIPNIEDIFDNYDIILNSPSKLQENIKTQFCESHICDNYNEILEIIKDIKPDYYEYALKTSQKKYIYFCNLFIMKKNDFFKYCDFIYDVLFEFDRRHNFTSDEDVLNYTMKFYKNNSSMFYYQSRLQGFLAERISNIFYQKNFKRIRTFDFGNY